MTSVRLWVYKCNARNPPQRVVSGDWEDFFAGGTQEWGTTQTIGSAVSLRILREEMNVGDLVLAVQTDRRAAIGVCRVAEFDDYPGDDDRIERELILEPVQLFERPVKLYDLKKTRSALARVQALRQGPIQSLYATTAAEARVLLRVCGVEEILDPPIAKAGAGFGDTATNRQVEQAAIRAVTAYYRGQGWRVRSVESDKLGYDLLVLRMDEKVHVEVKGVRGTQRAFLMTHRERLQAQVDPLFRLCVVTRALGSDPYLHWWSGGEVEHVFEFRPIAYQVQLR
jgi:Domain of unknown function (DUF3883)